MLSNCKIVNYPACFSIVVFPVRSQHSFLKLFSPAVSKLDSFCSYSYCSNRLTVFLNLSCFLFWKKCFYFKFRIRFFWWPHSNFCSFRNQFYPNHFFNIVVIAIVTIFNTFSGVSAFTINKAANILLYYFFLLLLYLERQLYHRLLLQIFQILV